MGLLDFFSSESKQTNWNQLENSEQLDQIIASSSEKPVVIFKHSTRCSISSMAKSRLTRDNELLEEITDFWYLDLIAYRHISNEIASRLGVPHESPQVLLLKDGQVTYNSSHHMINATELHKEAQA